MGKTHSLPGLLSRRIISANDVLRPQFFPLPAFAAGSVELLAGETGLGLTGAFFIVQPIDLVTCSGGVSPLRRAFTANSTCLFVLEPGASGLLSIEPI